MRSPGDHDLLFGVTALQLRFLTEEQLIAATSKLAEGSSGSISDQFRQMGLLSDAEVSAVSAVVERRLARFGNDARKTLDSISPEEAAILARVVPGDPTVRGESDTRDDQFATRQHDRFVTQPFESRAAASSGQQRFTVLRLHKTGGLGRLMVARDGELNREIALKEILPAYADSEQNRRRFVREAEITGALEHPGIVPVYSLGEFPDGRPYYAMRLVRGIDLRTAINDYHSRPGKPSAKNIEFRQLLGRFVDVCQAIHYAHSRGVVHRDIKPGNVMLGDFGETLVVDWGLAKPMGAKQPSMIDDDIGVAMSDRASADRTQAGRIVGTVQYMSPEQAEGRVDRISAATDIYGLGATLYHLLTGKPPFEGGEDDTVLRVQQGRFPSPRTHDRHVPRPLEAVCLKAMARKPKDRYATAQELAAEIERYLADERVHAYREPMHARTWRWIRHHRTPVLSLMAAAVVAVTALSIGVTLLKVQRDRAEHNLQLAQDAVREYYIRVSEETLLNQPGMQPLRDTLLRLALASYDKFLEERKDDPKLRRQVAQAQFYVGRITETVDLPEKALPYYREAVNLQKQLLATAAPQESGELTAEYAQSLNALGKTLQSMRRLDEAKTNYQLAADLREKLAEENPDDAERARTLASSVMNLGVLSLLSGDPAAALPLLERAQGLRLAHVDRPEDAPASIQRDLGMGYYNLALAHLNLGDLEQGESNLFKAVGAFDQLALTEPHDLDNRRRLAICRRMIADGKAAAGDVDAAIEFSEQAAETLRDLVLHNPNVPQYAADLAGVQMNLSTQLDARGDLDGALRELSAAAEALRKLHDRQDAAPEHQRDLGVALRAAGETLVKLDRREEARKRLEESRSVLERLVRKHPDVESYAQELKNTVDAQADLNKI